jgi:hypothetical protein
MLHNEPLLTGSLPPLLVLLLTYSTPGLLVKYYYGIL